MRSRPTDRLRGLALAAAAAAACIAAVAAAPASAGEPLVPYIVGGAPTSIVQFPWQVFIQGKLAPHEFVGCGGSILNATEILTAAHCVDHEESTLSYPASDFFVVSGTNNLAQEPPTEQIDQVASFRTHPYYDARSSSISDDVAVLTLEKPLELSPAKDAQAIGLVAESATPAPGTPLTISGYGKQSGAEGAEPDGRLYSTTLTAISSDACRNMPPIGLNSAVLLCAESATSSTCQGDSGGPLVGGSPAVEVGIVDFGQLECPAGAPDAFTNVAAPEIRAFIDGSETPPIAARPISGPALRSVRATPVDFSPLTCEAGAWSGSPTFTYSFEVDGATPLLLQSGPSDSYVPPNNLIGATIVCVVQASNPGGVSTLRTATTAAIALDTAAPSASISGAPKCHRQACTIAIGASDPNAVAFSLHPSVSYAVVSACPRKKRKKAGRPALCHRTKTVAMALGAASANAFHATVARLPYGERVKFSVHARNAAGLSQRTPATTTTLLRKPKPKNSKPAH
jgi:secreted trypsin-like serine protease